MRAVLVLVHGFHSRNDYYDNFAREVSARGIAVYTLDARGLHRSFASRFAAQRFVALEKDLDALLYMIRDLESPRPIFVLGQGAGGISAALWAMRHEPRLAGLICSGITLEPAMHATVLRSVKALSNWMHVPVLDAIAAVAGHADRLRPVVSQLTLPLLALHGSADRVALPSGSEYLHGHAGSRDKTLEIFEGYYHDPINELGNGVVVDRICQWIDARLDTTISHSQIGIGFINLDS